MKQRTLEAVRWARSQTFTKLGTVTRTQHFTKNLIVTKLICYGTIQVLRLHKETLERICKAILATKSHKQKRA